MQAVQVAARMMDEYKDNLVITMFGRQESDKDQFSRFSSKAQEVAMKNSIPLMRIYLEFLVIKEDAAIDEKLITLANSHDNGSSILVLGAAGKGNEDKTGTSRPGGQAPMGAIAMSCLTKCKVPVVLVKSGPRLDLDVARIKRAGRDNTPGLNIMLCLDQHAVTRMATDMALAIATKLDSVYAFHVATKTEESQHVVHEYTSIMDKASTSGKHANATFVTVEKTKSIKEHIDHFVDDMAIDLIFMGSTELSKPDKSHFLGSVSSAVTKSTVAHCCVVKNFATT